MEITWYEYSIKIYRPAKGRPTPSMKSIPGLVFFPEPYEFELERREIKNNF